jgi:predicted  nucleic acid-binding Zn-ribbon protein
MATYWYICWGHGCDTAGAAFQAESDDPSALLVCPTCGGEAHRYIPAAEGIDEAIDPGTHAITTETHNEMADAKTVNTDRYRDEKHILVTYE